MNGTRTNSPEASTHCMNVSMYSVMMILLNPRIHPNQAHFDVFAGLLQLIKDFTGAKSSGLDFMHPRTKDVVIWQGDQEIPVGSHASSLTHTVPESGPLLWTGAPSSVQVTC